MKGDRGFAGENRGVIEDRESNGDGEKGDQKRTIPRENREGDKGGAS